jgi:hypothetical protein
MAVLYGISAHQIADREGQVASLHERTQRAEQQSAALASYTTFAQMRSQRVAAVQALVDSRFDWAHVLHEFGRVLPRGVAITSLTGTVGSTAAGGAAAKSSTSTSSSSTSSASSAGSSNASAASTVTSSTPPGSVPTFQITGCTRTQTQVAETLTRLRLIDGVSEVALQASSKGSAAGGPSVGGAGGATTCPASATDFGATVTFQPLPSAGAGVTSTHTSTVSVSGK